MIFYHSHSLLLSLPNIFLSYSSYQVIILFLCLSLQIYFSITVFLSHSPSLPPSFFCPCFLILISIVKTKHPHLLKKKYEPINSLPMKFLHSFLSCLLCLFQEIQYSILSFCLQETSNICARSSFTLQIKNTVHFRK